MGFQVGLNWQGTPGRSWFMALKILYLQLGEQALVSSQACYGLLASPGRSGGNLSLEALLFT